jgi:hypothetical protein
LFNARGAGKLRQLPEITAFDLGALNNEIHDVSCKAEACL